MQHGAGETADGAGEVIGGNGRARTALLILAGVMAAEVCLIGEEPGAALGLYALLLAGILCAARERPAWGWGEGLMLGLLVVSALQSIRFISLSNLLVLAGIVTCLVGASGYAGLASFWARWLEGGLTFIRPLGVWHSFQAKARPAAAEGPPGQAWIRHWLRVLGPALGLVLVFGWLLGAGNAVLGQWSIAALTRLEAFLMVIEFPSAARVMAWGFFAGLALVVTCPAQPATRWSGLLAGRWHAFGSREGGVRRQQWLAVLLAMNLLFLVSTVTDVIYLWMSRELPEGVSHSQYLHQGVNLLIATTVLSALILGTLTQHADPVRKNRLVRGLALLWMLQNLVLISGVFQRLWIYVDAYGYTPKRVYVMLFLLLVVGGYAFLGWAVLQLRSARWLVGANLLLVSGYFSVLQLADVPAFVAGRNIRLYQAGRIAYPEPLYLRQIGCHAIPALIAIHEHPRTDADRQRARDDLLDSESFMDRIGQRSWQAFQYRDHANWKALRAFCDRAGIQVYGSP